MKQAAQSSAKSSRELPNLDSDDAKMARHGACVRNQRAAMVEFSVEVIVIISLSGALGLFLLYLFVSRCCCR
jgi:hypothetical protein